MSAPAISVVLPVRDAQDTVAEAIESLIAQTFDDHEILVVDDGSSDDTPSIVGDLGAREDRIRLVESPRPGIVPALNEGLRVARGSLIARHDADDVALPERFERQRDWLGEHPDVALVGCLVETFPRDGREGMLRYESWINGLVEHDDLAREFFVESPVAHPSVLMRREALEGVGGYRDHGWPEDYDLWLRLLAAGARFGKVPEVLLRWRDEPTRLSRTSEVYARDQFLRAKARYLGPVWLRERDRVLLWGAGPTGRRFARFLREEGIEVAGFVDIDPRKVGRERQGVPVRAPDSLDLASDPPLLIAVGARDAREEIRAHLVPLGYVEGTHFLCVA